MDMTWKDVKELYDEFGVSNESELHDKLMSDDLMFFLH